jgi:hypothetical protein
MNARAWVVIGGVAACVSTKQGGPGGDPQIELVPTKTVKLQIGPVGIAGDGFDFGTDAAAVYAADLRIIRANPDALTVDHFVTEGAARAVDVGAVATLADVPMPPMPFGMTPLPPTIGEGFAVLSQHGCPVAVRVTDATYGTAMPGSGPPIDHALMSVSIEYAQAVCDHLTVNITVVPPAGSCPPPEIQAGAMPITAALTDWPPLLTGTSQAPQLQFPHGFDVTLTSMDPVEWSGPCSGSSNCTVTMDGNKTVSGTITIPLRCWPGA